MLMQHHQPLPLYPSQASCFVNDWTSPEESSEILQQQEEGAASLDTSSVPCTAATIRKHHSQRHGASQQGRLQPTSCLERTAPTTSVGLAIRRFEEFGRELPYRFYPEEENYDYIIRRAVALSVLPLEDQFRFTDLRDFLGAVTEGLKYLFPKGALAVELHHGRSSARTAFMYCMKETLAHWRTEVEAWEKLYPQPELRVPIDPSITMYERMLEVFHNSS